MWRKALLILVFFVALQTVDMVHRPAEAGSRPGIACGVSYWSTEHRMVRSDALARVLSAIERPRCARIASAGLSEVRPGLAVGRTGSTVTVVADRDRVEYRAVDGRRLRAPQIAGDVVVNANWFTARGSIGPVVTDGHLSGSADTVERGQIIARRADCSKAGAEQLRHIWTGARYRHDDCIIAAVSGVSLVHKRERADAYAGFDITNGYTNTSRSHSFIGFNATEIIVIATNEMNASELADYAISIGATEGVMLDGGGSTQIETPTERLTSSRPVTAFVVLNVKK